MRKECLGNWKKVYDLIEELEPEQFNMADLLYKINPEINSPQKFGDIKPACNTAGCIKGWATIAYLRAIQHRDEAKIPYGDLDQLIMPYHGAVNEWLGFERGEYQHIFYGHWSPKRLGATKEEALAYIKGLIETGDVYHTSLV